DQLRRKGLRPENPDPHLLLRLPQQGHVGTAVIDDRHVRALVRDRPRRLRVDPGLAVRPGWTWSVGARVHRPAPRGLDEGCRQRRLSRSERRARTSLPASGGTRRLVLAFMDAGVPTSADDRYAASGRRHYASRPIPVVTATGDPVSPAPGRPV